ncbi:hypothetical protein [Rhodococcus sp. T2V]|uniref:hypothetical protein n=1 Tax=Rhodococcus sp. T2V TaxID=3034164 RepID=UPI0023E2259A|nr:hypothetical protein [Rhodococcus sp. T2V]MDF3312830.1 hypothetical protein [Rhodococcus sp. T2V]
MLGPGALPQSVARVAYRLVRIPLQLIEDIALCDLAAAHLLDDPGAAARAAALFTRTSPPSG